MRIAIIGYGKMGKEIEKIALDRGHEITLRASSMHPFKSDDLSTSDVAIEFSNPKIAVDNIFKCFEGNTPVVVGTTGWYNRFNEVRHECENSGAALLHATNFSIGVNLFFQLNRQLAELMNKFEDYNPAMSEIHHTEKLDAPSGTAITLAEDLIYSLERKEKWVNDEESKPEELEIISKRIDSVPGTHNIKYSSAVDEITIEHLAKNRKGFALGAVLAAEWVVGKKGVFNMNDLLSI